MQVQGFCFFLFENYLKQKSLRLRKIIQVVTIGDSETSLAMSLAKVKKNLVSDFQFLLFVFFLNFLIQNFYFFNCLVLSCKSQQDLIESTQTRIESFLLSNCIIGGKEVYKDSILRRNRDPFVFLMTVLSIIQFLHL